MGLGHDVAFGLDLLLLNTDVYTSVVDITATAGGNRSGEEQLPLGAFRKLERDRFDQSTSLSCTRGISTNYDLC